MHRFVALILASALMASSAAAESVTSRNGGPSSAEMTARSSAGAPEGTAFFRPVLSGVLYRSGFSGGDKKRTGLSQAQRGALCEAGFSKAFYADFGKSTSYGVTSCASGSLDYQSARSSRPSNVLKAVHEAIKKPSSGPVLVHCMWGVHASGALSAMSLVQFCGWSETRAKAYWDKTRNGAPCSGGCDKWIDAKFAKFKVDPNLSITDAERAAICPK
ncbi:hypothetical protein [Pelagimonas varians]|uniref:Tyrosine specific protein phosphatases domain-containing protein n=1 Tax=Pelagimonas varians TaxID=696760 RepID=A0A238L5C5_9RHOB|nr:hypothetical protein [Pelagimonas varians]PYG26264.1 hypothetical protein C8N36_1267 [Pelagimonas varians]SMX50050.1 hypothetical protein PEV8663_04460 [Pelagimonas varians]